ncbi:MAG: TIGR01906 family membrane protein [Dehalococcoidia bacterium]
MTIRITKIVTYYIFVISLPLLLISMNVGFMVNAGNLYEYEFEKYEVAEETGIESEELSRAAGELIDYLTGTGEFPQIQVVKGGEQIELFTPREITHLEDVKGIVQFFYLILWITLAYSIMYIIAGFVLRKRAFLRPLMKGLLCGSVVTLALVAFVGIWALIDFDSLFLRFHLSSFSNDFWQLPSSSYLLKMFPEGFFSDAALLLVGDTVVECLILIVPTWFYLRRNSSSGQPDTQQILAKP